MKVLHIVTSLEQGGAQAVLFRLTTAGSSRVNHEIISLTDDGFYGPKLRAADVPVQSIGLGRGSISIPAIVSLYRAIKKSDPDLIQTWMYHADLVGGVVARFAGVGNVIWGIRNSDLSTRGSKLTTRLVARLCALLSALIPKAIVSCSQSGRAIHQALGYQSDRFYVIPNGFDTEVFAPKPHSRAHLRQELGLGEKEKVLGMVARWDSQKDFPNLLAAMRIVWARYPEVRLLLAGSGILATNKELITLIQGADGEARTLLLGPLEDVPKLMNCIDVLVLSSRFGEAFPNVIGEAMACGTPCVVTDVGDSAHVVGQAGWVVPPAQPKELAARIEEALEQVSGSSGRQRAEACRERIRTLFHVEIMREKFEEVWRSNAS